MRFEQPGELSRIMAAADGSTLKSVLREILPVIVYCAVTGVSIAAGTAFNNWLEGVQNKSLLPRILLAAVGFVVLPLITVAVTHYIYVGTKRTLYFDDDRVKASSHRPVLNVSWKNIRQFEIEPVNGRDDLARVSVTAALGTKQILTRFSIVLDRAAQLPTLLTELRSRARTAGFTIVETKCPLRLERRPVRGLWPAMIGLFFFTIGFPLAMAGVLEPDARDRPRRPRPIQFEHFVKRHFQSSANLRRAFIVAGSAVTGLGAVFYVWGWRLLDRRGKLVQTDLASRLDRVRTDSSSCVLFLQR